MVFSRPESKPLTHARARGLYNALDAWLGDLQHKWVLGSAFITLHRHTGYITVRLHQTDIAEVTESNVITMYNGGFQTNLTKTVLNTILPEGVRIKTVDGVWYVVGPASTHVYRNGMRIDAEGKVLPAPDVVENLDDLTMR